MNGLSLGLAVASMVLGAGDGDVQWNGVSHIGAQDRVPVVPTGGAAFDVRFRAWQGDLTGARVVFNDGATGQVDAAVIGQIGPYDIWGATVPGTAAASLRYYVELTDGADTDYLGPAGMAETPPPDGGWLIDYATLSHAPRGAWPASTGTAFRVWAPNATQAWVRGEFNGWGTTHPMAPLGDDFVRHVPTAQPGQKYKFYLNPGALWRTDAVARSIDPGDFFNSRIVDTDGHEWQEEGFQVPPFEQMVIYELHVGTFAGRNDPVASGAFPSRYADVAAHAAHLAELGVNVVELMPIVEFPTDVSAGYNPTTMWAPESAYGSPEDLKAMIDVLHQHGIAVIQDIVWNHFSGSDNFLWFYDGSQIYFDTPAVETPWGSQADFDRPEVREYFLQSADQWLDEYRFDGFRFDATDFMNIPPQEASGWSLMQALTDRMKARNAHKIAIAEQLPDDPWVTRPTSLGGAGFDSQWFDFFTDTLRAQVIEAKFGDPSMAALADVIDGAGDYLSGRFVVNYLEAHDEIWPSTGGQRLVKTIDPNPPHDDEWARGRIKLAQGLVFASPGIPMIVQGSEWLEDTGFGAEAEFRIDWSKKQTYSGVFRFFRDMIGLRTQSPALFADMPVQTFHINETDNVIAFQRFNFEGNVVVVVANFGNTTWGDYRIGLPQPGSWYELVNSQSAYYNGDGMDNCGELVAEPIAYDGHPQSISLTLPRMGFIVLRHNDAPSGRVDLDSDGIANGCDNCPDLANAAQADSNNDGVGDACDCDADGQVDAEQIAQTPGLDADGNGVLDSCEGPDCLCDVDGSGTVESTDFFNFISDFLAGDADLDGSGSTTSGDFFLFIACFVDPGSACP